MCFLTPSHRCECAPGYRVSPNRCSSVQRTHNIGLPGPSRFLANISPVAMALLHTPPPTSSRSDSGGIGRLTSSWIPSQLKQCCDLCASASVGRALIPSCGPNPPRAGGPSNQSCGFRLVAEPLAPWRPWGSCTLPQHCLLPGC